MAGLVEHFWILGLGLVGFLLLWPISIVRRDASIVDFWWGPGIGVMTVALWVSMGSPVDAATLLIAGPLLIWSVRLGIHLGFRRLLEGAEDPRYTELRHRFAPGWWWKSLFIVFILQGFLQVTVGLGALAGMANAATLGASPIAVLLALASVTAIGVQALSDAQLDVFRRTTPRGGLLTTGLRRFVRYPSYAAEILFWCAMAGLAMLYGVWWAPVSAMLTIGLLRFVSGVAILEERLARTRKDFPAYRDSVPALVPRLGRWRCIRQKTADQP